MTIKCIRFWEDTLNDSTTAAITRLMAQLDEYLKKHSYFHEEWIINVQLATEPFENRKIDVLYCFYRGA